MLRNNVPWLLVLATAFTVTCSDAGDSGGDNAGADSAAIPDAGAASGDIESLPDMDPSSLPVIHEMHPSDGLANATTRVVLVGQNFGPGARVYIDGGAGDIIMAVSIASSASLSFVMPKNPYGAPSYDTPQKVSVSVLVDGVSSNALDFQYTVSLPMDATFKGSVLGASTDAFTDFPSEPIAAQVFAKGVTDSGPGETSSLAAQIGFGPQGADPGQEDGWKWFKARFREDSPSRAGYDVFDGTLKVPLVRTYDVAFRFSRDGGQTWIYADADESDLKYDTAAAAKLHAAEAPTGYCQTDGDCTTNLLAVVCKMDPADWTRNRCVGCLADSDCTDNPKALGPKCFVSENLCFCTEDSDCASNVNGLKCLSSYCGCASDAHCAHVAGRKCAAVGKLQLCM